MRTIAYDKQCREVVSHEGRRLLRVRASGTIYYNIFIVEGDSEPTVVARTLVIKVVQVGIDWLLANMPEHVDIPKLYCLLADSN